MQQTCAADTSSPPPPGKDPEVRGMLVDRHTRLNRPWPAPQSPEWRIREGDAPLIPLPSGSRKLNAPSSTASHCQTCGACRRCLHSFCPARRRVLTPSRPRRRAANGPGWRPLPSHHCRLSPSGYPGSLTCRLRCPKRPPELIRAPQGASTALAAP